VLYIASFWLLPPMTTAIYTLSLHDALPICVINDLPPFDCCTLGLAWGATYVARSFSGDKKQLQAILKTAIAHNGLSIIDVISPRSEEHTSELQSRENLVCRLLLEKKKQKTL